MAQFSKRSLDNLETCDLRLQELFKRVIQITDCTIVCGYRNNIDQNNAYYSGRSQLMFPGSKHNTYPSKAVDVVPYPIDWNDINRLYMFTGLVRGVASMMGISIISGADWNNNFNIKDQKFVDLPHYQLVD